MYKKRYIQSKHRCWHIYIVILLLSALNNAGVEISHLLASFITTAVGRKWQIGEHKVDWLETLIEIIIKFGNTFIKTRTDFLAHQATRSCADNELAESRISIE